MAETTMSSRGQVVIPVEIRKALNLERNARFRVEERDGCIVLVPIHEDDWRSLSGCVKGGSSMTRWLEREHRKDRERER